MGPTCAWREFERRRSLLSTRAPRERSRSVPNRRRGLERHRSRNNVALHNVHVQPDDLGDADTAFYVVGSSDQDSLLVLDQLEAGAIQLMLPAQALPWRDIRVIEESGGQRPRYGGDSRKDPLSVKRARLKRAEIQLFTDIIGAAAAHVNQGIATIDMGDSPLFIPQVRIAEGARMPVRLRVREAKATRKLRFVHVTQLSGGRRIGGVSLELRARSGKRS